MGDPFRQKIAMNLPTPAGWPGFTKHTAAEPSKMDLATLAQIAPAAVGAALVWLWRYARRLRFSMDLKFRIRTDDGDG